MPSITSAISKTSQKTSPKSKKTQKVPLATQLSAPTLEESFAKSTQHQAELHLKEEHQTKIDVQNQLHRARIEAIRSQLQLQLYTIWNEIWLQRQKSFSQLHKEWLKVFTA